MGGILKPVYMGVAAQQFGNGVPERAGSCPMDDSNRVDLSQESIVQELVDHIYGLIHPPADQVNFVFVELLG